MGTRVRESRLVVQSVNSVKRKPRAPLEKIDEIAKDDDSMRRRWRVAAEIWKTRINRGTINHLHFRVERPVNGHHTHTRICALLGESHRIVHEQSDRSLPLD